MKQLFQAYETVGLSEIAMENSVVETKTGVNGFGISVRFPHHA